MGWFKRVRARGGVVTAAVFTAAAAAAMVLGSAVTPAETVTINPYAFGGPGALAATYNGTSSTASHSTATNFADSKLVTASFWVKRSTASGSNTYRVFTVNENDIGFTFMFFNDLPLFQGQKTGGTNILNVSSTPALTDTANWHHVLFSVDLSNTSKRHFYIDDSSTGNWLSYDTTGTMDMTGTPYRFGSNAGSNQWFPGSLSEVWIDIGTYIDLSVQANRRLFIDSNLKPADLRADGSNPTGSSPEIYLPEGDPASNRGTTASYTNSNITLNAQGPNP